jgi:Delta3,5-Delta2,4-dienoyl-CoA isomerase
MSVFNLPQPQWFKISSPTEFVAHVEINRPQKLNAFFTPMWHELRGIFKHLSTHPDVRCVVLSGAGDRAFTAGKYSSTNRGARPNS